MLLALLDSKEPMDFLVLPDLMEHKEPLDSVGNLDSMGHPVLMVNPDGLAGLELPVAMEHPVQLVHQELQVNLVVQDIQENADQPDHLDRLAILEPRAQADHKDQLVPRV